MIINSIVIIISELKTVDKFPPVCSSKLFFFLCRCSLELSCNLGRRPTYLGHSRQHGLGQHCGICEHYFIVNT